MACTGPPSSHEGHRRGRCDSLPQALRPDTDGLSSHPRNKESGKANWSAGGQQFQTFVYENKTGVGGVNQMFRAFFHFRYQNPAD